jgi:hypothetical protein
MPRYWFRQKKYGYGATPNSWQGWLLTLVSSGLVIGLVVAADFMRGNEMRFWLIALGLPLVAVPAVLITHAKTEGGWRWVRSGSPKGE